MILEDLIKTLFGNTVVVITALAYFKNSKKYFSFRTVIDHETIKNCKDKLDEDILKTRIKSIHINEGVLWIDVIEFITND